MPQGTPRAGQPSPPRTAATGATVETFAGGKIEGGIDAEVAGVGVGVNAGVPYGIGVEADVGLAAAPPLTESTPSRRAERRRR